MDKSVSRLKRDLITACKILSAEGLVKGFGHVSARIPNSDLFLITPRVSLELVRENQLVVLNLKGQTVKGKISPPFEASLHAAILNERPEINAVVRIHARAANFFSVTKRKIEPVHNHGSHFHGGVPVFQKTDLISTLALGKEAASVLAGGQAVLLRGNGQVTVGKNIPEAVIMAIYLEEAADILHGALQIGTPIPLSGKESATRQVETLPDVDLERAWNFFSHRVKREKR